MSFQAYLCVENERDELVQSSTGFWQDYDWRGLPSSKVKNNLIVLELRVKDTFFPKHKSWAASDWKRKDGYIEYIRKDADGVDHHWWFTNGLCCWYHFAFDSRGLGTESSTRIFIAIAPEQQGYAQGSGATWTPPPPRDYAYVPPAPAALTPPAAPANKRSKASKDGLVAGSPEHKAARWAEYQTKNADNPAAWSPERWGKQYDTNMRNVEVGLRAEDLYKAKFGGESKTLKTPLTHRQVDIFRVEKSYCGQLKTGKLSYGKQEKIDLAKDQYLIDGEGYEVEYILEKGGSKNLIQALEAIGAKVTIGSQL